MSGCHGNNQCSSTATVCHFGVLYPRLGYAVLCILLPCRLLSEWVGHTVECSYSCNADGCTCIQIALTAASPCTPSGSM